MSSYIYIYIVIYVLARLQSHTEDDCLIMRHFYANIYIYVRHL